MFVQHWRGNLNKIAARIGLFSALATSIATIGSIVTLLMFPAPVWTGLNDFITSFEDQLVLPSVFAFLITLFFIMLAFSILKTREGEVEQTLASIGVGFGIGYAILAGGVYFIQFTAVRWFMDSGTIAGVEHFIIVNPTSVALALDNLGYLFLFISVIFLALSMGGGRLEEAARYALAATSILGFMGVIGYVLKFSGLSDLLVVSGAVFLVATIILAVIFWNMMRAESSAKA